MKATLLSSDSLALTKAVAGVEANTHPAAVPATHKKVARAHEFDVIAAGRDAASVEDYILTSSRELTSALCFPR